MSAVETHRIRLHGPWTIHWAGKEASRWNLPQALPADVRGAVVLERAFGKPTGIEGLSVELVVAGLPDGAEIELNGTSIGSSTEGRFRRDIAGLLIPRNSLKMKVLVNEIAWEPFQSVFLEIAG